MQKVFFGVGEKNKLKKEEEKVLRLDLDVDSIGNSYALYKVLDEKFKKFVGEVEIDRDSYRNIQFSFSDLERDLALATLYLDNTFVSFSLKNTKEIDKDVKKWYLIGEDWSPEVKNIIESIEITKRLQNTPPNLLMPEDFVDESRKVLQGLDGIEINVIKGEDLKKERLELIRAVGGASDYDPRLLIIKYLSSHSNDIVALVGKGVCYDSGGLNIKTGIYMSSMKFDMSGGAVSLGVVKALAKAGSKQSVVVAIPLVENAVSSKSYRPDDVFICRNGTSVEIDNTDAEGRLVLADALAYVTDVYKPSEIITIATLTGAIGYALGSKYAGAWSTCDDRWKSLLDSSVKAGEFIWRMPLDEYYLKDLKKTRVADIKNSCRKGAGGSNRAAMFLKEFTNDLPYIHLDIANVDHCEATGEPNAPMLKTLYFYLNKT